MGKIINLNSGLPETEEADSKPMESPDYLGILLSKASEMEYNMFYKAVRSNAKPPIKGKLTEKKIKEAGIMRCFNEETMESWLEQRGERISEKFRIVWK
jgi:hypothetical protein